MIGNLRRSVAVVAVGMFLAGCAACSGDDDDDSAHTPPRESTTTTSTQPPGTSPAEVKPYVEDLLQRLDDATNQLWADPNAAKDPESELVAELKEIYAPDAEGLSGLLGSLQRLADQGYHIEALDSETAIRREVTGDLKAIDENAVDAPICVRQTYRKLDSAGTVIEYIPNLPQPGVAHASRVDGEWRLLIVDKEENAICTNGG